MCRIVRFNNVGDGIVEVDGQDRVNIWELLLWDVTCRRWRTEVLQALMQLLVLWVVMGLVSAPSVLVWGKVLDLMVLTLGHCMVMGWVAI